MGRAVDILARCVHCVEAEQTATLKTCIDPVNINSFEETTTQYRNPGNLHISLHSVRASTAYGEPSRQIVEIIPDGDEIMNELVRLVGHLHDNALKSYRTHQDVERVQRLAGAMGLEYPTTTQEA